MLWQELYIACVLETNSEKLKALIHETENAIVSRLQTLEAAIDEHQEIARASASLLVLKSERLGRPPHPRSRDQLPDAAGSEHIREFPPANVRSCAEYEQLFDKCLDALTRLQGFEDYPRSIGTLVESEVWRAERNYSAAFSALHQHTRRGCLVCEGALGVHLNTGFGATTYRGRELALWEHRKLSRDLPKRLSITPIKTDAWAPKTAIAEHLRISIRAWSCSLDRWWSTTFAQAKDWALLSKMALAGVVLLTIALRMSPFPPWQQIVRVPFGFSGILLIDVSLGFGAFLFVYDGNLARQVRHLRDWLDAHWSAGNG